MRRARVISAVWAVVLTGASATAPAQEAHPVPQVVESATVKVLRGLTAPDFDAEMKLMAASLGVSCYYCHVRGNYASDANAHKVTARRMLEMTRTINQQFFADYTPGPDESRLGRVTCNTCHQGTERPQG